MLCSRLIADSPFQFPVDEKVRVMTPNQIFDAFKEESEKRRSMLKNKCVVIGAGKTGMDAIGYLQRTMKVDPEDIAWVISNDVWMLNAHAWPDFSVWTDSLIKFNMDQEKALLALGEKGLFVRLDKNFTPTVFRFPSILPEESKLLQKVKTVIRRGRATAINSKYNSDVMVEFGRDNPPWKAFAPIEKCVFVHASSPGPFNDSDPDVPIFNNSKKMTLNIIFLPPVTLSMSVLAKIKAARRKGTLDLHFMRRLAIALGEKKSKVNKYTENDLLKMLIQPLQDISGPLQAEKIQAILFAVLDRDPMVALKWMKQNQLSMLSIPGLKSGAYDRVRVLCSNAKTIGLSENDERILNIIGEKIKSLKGM